MTKTPLKNVVDMRRLVALIARAVLKNSICKKYKPVSWRSTWLAHKLKRNRTRKFWCMSQRKYFHYWRDARFRFLGLQKGWYKNNTVHRNKKFKRLYKRGYVRFRKIKKSRLFGLLLRGHYEKLTGFSEIHMINIWQPFRRTFDRPWQSGGGGDAVSHFASALSHRIAEVGTQLNLTKSPLASRSVSYGGGITINGQVDHLAGLSSRSKFPRLSFFKPKDILKIAPKALTFFDRMGLIRGKASVTDQFNRLASEYNNFHIQKSLAQIGMVFKTPNEHIRHRSFRSSYGIRKQIRESVPCKLGAKFRPAKYFWGVFPRRSFTHNNPRYRRQRW